MLLQMISLIVGHNGKKNPYSLICTLDKNDVFEYQL